MNEMINITASAAITMSSREIAELTGKRHPDVKRDIERMMIELEEDVSKFARIYFDSMNRQQNEYHLDRELTETLLLGYSAPLRRKVLARLRELEGIVANPAVVLSDPASLRKLLLDNVEKVIELQARVEEMQSDVDALEHLTEANGSLNRTEAAKNLGVPPHILIRWMKTNGWTYRRPGSKEDIAYQSKISSGYLEHKVTTGPRPDGTEWISTQVRITPKGLTVLAKAFPASARAA